MVNPHAASLGKQLLRGSQWRAVLLEHVEHAQIGRVSRLTLWGSRSLCLGCSGSTLGRRRPFRRMADLVDTGFATQCEQLFGVQG